MDLNLQKPIVDPATPPVEAPPEAPAAPETPPVEAPKPAPEPAPKGLSGSEYYKNKVKQLEADNKQMKADREKLETDRLTEKEDFKKLWENEKDLRIKAEGKATNLSDTVQRSFKLEALKTEAVKAGMLESALADIDMIDDSMVEIETTSLGTINILGAKECIERHKVEKFHWYDDAVPPVINNENPPATPPVPEEMTSMQLVDLEKTDHAKYKAEILKRAAARKNKVA